MMPMSGRTQPLGWTDKEVKMTIGTAVITPNGEAVVIEQLPHTSAVRVQYLDKRTQRKFAGKGDILYPADLTVKAVR